MARKRPAGHGSIGRHPDGRWVARISYIDQATGQRRRVAAYAKTHKAVLAKLDELRGRIADGKPATDSAITVGAWMARWCETSLAASSRAETTIENYSTLSRKHLEGGQFADLPLRRLKPNHIEGLIVELREKGLSQSTVRSVFNVLRLGLSGAERDGLIAKNPAAVVPRPGVDQAEVKHLPADQLIAVLHECEDSRHSLAVRLLAATGLRRGEVLALHWSDVDLDAGRLRVVGTLGRCGGKLAITPPKTARSRRTVPIPTEMVELLRQHRTAQKRERLRAANQWQDSDLVFTTPLGGPTDPRNLLRTIQEAAARLGLEDVGAHSIRHSVATLLLEGGAHVKLVADVLGHSDPGLTLRVYAHAVPDLQRSAVDDLAARLSL
jgi:integrase